MLTQLVGAPRSDAVVGCSRITAETRHDVSCCTGKLELDPLAIEALQKAGYQTDSLRPKRWRDFTGSNAPVLDFVFTLSDTASREPFPEWPGKPVSSHWHYPDPVATEGDEWQKRREHGRTLSVLERQMRAFMLLSLDTLDRIALKKHLDEMGTLDVEPASAPNESANKSAVSA